MISDNCNKYNAFYRQAEHNYYILFKLQQSNVKLEDSAFDLKLLFLYAIEMPLFMSVTLWHTILTA